MDFQDIFQKNRKSTQRLTELVQELSNEELTKTLSNGWPVFVTLAHLAFWDQRVIHVLNLAKKNKILFAPSFDIQLNDILTPIFQSIPPKEAVKLAIGTADLLDRMLEESSVQILEELMKINNRLVERSFHRNSHLDSIENIIKKRK